MRFTLLVATLGLFALGCRGSDNPMGDDAPPVDAPPGTTEVTIQEIQSDAIAPNTPVKLEGVVVTGVDTYGARTGEFYVQEPEGGAFSGVKVFNAPLDQVAALAIGDVVTITNAVKVEYRYEPMEGSPFPPGQSLTELVPVEGGTMTVTKTGTGTTVTTDVDAAAIDMLATPEERDAEWEKWEGVLINVRKARQTSALTSFGAGADDQKAFRTTGRLEVQSAMTSLGAATIDTCYESLIGIGDYFFSYKLAPRTEADIVAGGADCPPGFSQVTIAEIQSGAALGTVMVEGYVTAIAFNKKSFWVSQSLTAAPNEGIFVYRGQMSMQPLPADIVVGAKVRIRATAKEFNNDMMGETTTQLDTVQTVELVEAPTGQPTAVSDQLAAALTLAATGEPYESVLVTLSNVKINSVGDMASNYVGSFQQGATTFLSDDDILRLPAADVGKCYATVTGIWTYQVYSNAYGLLPISATGTGTCN